MIGRFTTSDPLADKYLWYTQYQFAGNEVPNAIDRDGMEPAFPKPDGTFTIARDGQLQKPLSDPDGARYVSSKTELGAGSKFTNALVPAASTIGTTITAAGYAGSVVVGPSGAYVGGSGVRMITPANQPIVPPGYKP